MFSKWLQTAKESASQFIEVASSVVMEVSEKTNAYIRDNIVKPPADCTFIASNMIAMGFPGNPHSRKIEGIVNNRDVIASYLETHYPNHYRLFNLTEEVYDSLLFNDSVENFNFTGYSAPPLHILFEILIRIEEWLGKDDKNVAIVHCFDGTGRTMTVCSCFLVWVGWFPNTEESLFVCLNRRGIPRSLMLPSQLRYIQYFDSLMQGSFLPSGLLKLTRVTVTNLPDMENGCCSPIIEIFNQNQLVFSNYRKGSKSRGIVTPYNAEDTVVFKPDIIVQGNLFIRCRHLGANETIPTTLLRAQFHTGYIKLFKVDLAACDVDVSVSLSDKLHILCDFLPVEEGELINRVDMSEMEVQLYKENSVLWGEILRKKEMRTKANESEESEESVCHSDDTEVDAIDMKKESGKVTPKESSIPVVSDAALDLESMLKNYENDMNLDSSVLLGEEFNLEDYESVLEASILQMEHNQE